MPQSFQDISIRCARMESQNAKMCAGPKFRARGGPAKTGYSGHLFSRLMRGASKRFQPDRPAYLMRES